MALFHAFTPCHFGCQALLQVCDQFAESQALVGLFLEARIGSSMTLLGYLLGQYTVETSNGRVACDNGVTQMRLLFHDLHRQFIPLRYQGGETPDICTIGCTNQMGEHVHIGKGGFDQFWGRCPVRKNWRCSSR